MALIFGSYATEASEPGQVVTEAALRNTFRVPWGRLEGVNCLLSPGGVIIESWVHGRCPFPPFYEHSHASRTLRSYCEKMASPGVR